MVTIAGGPYRPFFRETGEPDDEVRSFRLELRPVSNRQFLGFVAANPEWRRSNAKRLFVDDTYLAHWADDLDLGDAAAGSPVVNVSWFAARAYAEWAGRRLPTLAEWELAAGANQPTTPEDLPGELWEWVEDFNITPMRADPIGVGADRRVCRAQPVDAAAARDYATFMRFAFRSSSSASFTMNSLGFRCAAAQEEQNEDH